MKRARWDDLEGVLVVSRFFGGVKLGPAVVGRAFRAAGEGALDQLQPGNDNGGPGLSGTRAQRRTVG